MKQKQPVMDLIMAVCAVFISLMIFKLAKIPLGQLLPEGFFRDMLGEAVFAGCALAFVLVLKKTEIFKCDGEKLKMEWISAFMVFVMMALPAFSAVVELGHLTCSAGEFIMFLIYVFLIGFTEEVLFRGLVQNAFFRLFKYRQFCFLHAGTRVLRACHGIRKPESGQRASVCGKQDISKR